MLVTQTVIENMNRIEAQACLLAIRGNLEGAKQKTIDFDRRLGWKALDYPSLATCFEAELGITFQHGYRLLAAAEVESNIQNLSPMGENPIIRERWVRESGIAKLEPEQQSEAYQIALRIAESETAKHLTATHIKQAVQQVVAKHTVFQTKYFPVSQLFATGKIGLDAARAFVEALDEQLPRKRGYILQLVAKYGFANAELLAPIAGMFDRPEGQESLVLPEVLGGFLGGVALAKATISDLKRANYEASQQHAATGGSSEADPEKPTEVNVSFTLPICMDWEQWKRVLEAQLGETGFNWLHKMMLNE